jgi:hypothetical protein
LEIAYSKRSKFLEACEAAIRSHRAQLDAGRTVYVNLGGSGFEERIVVTIRPEDRVSFGSDWKSSDPTWFPARIKAAETALLNCNCGGAFEVSHEGGSLAIRAV